MKNEFALRYALTEHNNHLPCESRAACAIGICVQVRLHMFGSNRSRDNSILLQLPAGIHALYIVDECCFRGEGTLPEVFMFVHSWQDGSIYKVDYYTHTPNRKHLGYTENPSNHSCDHQQPAVYYSHRYSHPVIKRRYKGASLKSSLCHEKNNPFCLFLTSTLSSTDLVHHQSKKHLCL